MTVWLSKQEYAVGDTLRSNRAPILKRSLRAGWIALVLMVAVPAGFPQCAQRVTMRSYSLCVAAGLRVERNDTDGVVVVCDTEKRASILFRGQESPHGGRT